MLAQLESGVSVGVGWGLGRLGVYAGEPSRHHGWERGLYSVVNLDQVWCDRPPTFHPHSGRRPFPFLHPPLLNLQLFVIMCQNFLY